MTDNAAKRASALPAAERDLYRAILRAFPTFGGSPSAEWIVGEAQARGLDPEAALADLEGRDLLARDPDTGAIAFAFPFSGTPTPHRVQLAGGQPVFALCAVDALGLPLMFGRAARITSVDPLTGEPVVVEVQDGNVRSTPPEPVVFYCKPGGQGLSGHGCPVIHFFASPASAERYVQEHVGRPGEVLSLAEALAVGRRQFGTLLAPNQEHGKAGGADET